MELKNWTYEEFRDYTYDKADGVIETTGDEVGVTYVNDVEYANINGTALHLQILMPKTRNNPEPVCPCVIYVQGSAWMKQNCYRDVPQVAKLAARGFVCVMVEYRHSGIAAYPSQAIDANNAVRFMRAHAEEYHIDPERIVMTGNSSGGHTALAASLLNDDDSENNLFPGISAKTKGIINYYGSTSFIADDSNPVTSNHCKADSPEGMVMGHVDMTDEMIRELSIECHIHPETEIGPVLILHGTKDRMVNTTCSTAVYERLKECGKEASYYLIHGADHGGPEFWKPEVLDLVEKYIRNWIAR